MWYAIIVIELDKDEEGKRTASARDGNINEWQKEMVDVIIV